MNLMEYLPERHRAGPVGAAQEAMQPLLDALENAEEDLVRQLWPASATWGLALWEQALGLSTDVTANEDYRRSRVVSKLRGSGTTTAALIQNVAESYLNGHVDVIEHPAESRFDLEFMGAQGIPPNLSELKDAIEEIKPAHLAFSFLYTYMTWAAFEAYTHTWAAWDALGLTWDKFTVYKE